jgi:septal ring factor EnvC (AmiA/AmiB activator)
LNLLQDKLEEFERKWKKKQEKRERRAREERERMLKEKEKRREEKNEKESDGLPKRVGLKVFAEKESKTST